MRRSTNAETHNMHTMLCRQGDNRTGGAVCVWDVAVDGFNVEPSHRVHSVKDVIMFILCTRCAGSTVRLPTATARSVDCTTSPVVPLAIEY